MATTTPGTGLTGVFDNVTINGTPLTGGRFAAGVLGAPGDTGYTFSLGSDAVTYDDTTGVISASVPEPGTLGLLGVGALGLPARRRRIARRR